MKTLVAFGSEGYERGLDALARSAAPHFDRLRLFLPDDIDAGFRAENPRVLACPRGYGYWLWKPYFIRRALEEAAPGDFVFYCDALMTFVDSPAPLFPLCQAAGGIMLFHQRGEGHRNFTYTRADCFQRMAATGERYTRGDHLNAAFQLYQKTERALAFVDELLGWCRDWGAISDAPSTTGANAPGFIDHRHDQSILSILAIKHELPTFRDISQWGLHAPDDLPPQQRYGQIVFHHRWREPPA